MIKFILLLCIILGCIYSKKLDYKNLCSGSSPLSKSGICEEYLPADTNNQSLTNRTLLTAEFDFALSLLDKLSADKSCIVSPFSISLALSLVHSGTKGTARKEIEQLLLKGTSNEEFSHNFSNLIQTISREREGVDFQLANRVFVKKSYPLLNSYSSSIRKNYKADAISLDFADSVGSAKEVNSFVSEVTHGRIEKIFTPASINQRTRMILVNAVFMEATWAEKFDEHETRREEFYVNKTAERRVSFVRHNYVHRDYYENDQFKLLSLKYKDTRYRFNVFLPKEMYGLGKLLRELTGKKIENILASQMKQELLKIKLPKFKIESEFSLIPVLKALGVKRIFTGGQDLSGFTGSTGLYVSEAVHKATIGIDEKGTKVTSVTGFTFQNFMATIDDIQPKYFTANHPFMFCITFNNHPVFIGEYH